MRGPLRDRLAELVAAATDGEVSAAEALAGEESLPALGVTSLGYLRLLDALEREFDVALDLDGDQTYLDSVDGLAAHLAEHGVGAAVRPPAPYR